MNLSSSLKTLFSVQVNSLATVSNNDNIFVLWYLIIWFSQLYQNEFNSVEWLTHCGCDSTWTCQQRGSGGRGLEGGAALCLTPCSTKLIHQLSISETKYQDDRLSIINNHWLKLKKLYNSQKTKRQQQRDKKWTTQTTDSTTNHDTTGRTTQAATPNTTYTNHPECNTATLPTSCSSSSRDRPVTCGALVGVESGWGGRGFVGGAGLWWTWVEEP